MTIATVYLLGLVVIGFAPDTGGKMLTEDASLAPDSTTNGTR